MKKSDQKKSSEGMDQPVFLRFDLKMYEGGGEAILYLLSCIREECMPFATEAEQIRKFENDEVAQHYFEVL